MRSQTNCLLKDKQEKEEFVGEDFDMVEPRVVEPEDHPPKNPNDSEVEDRYPK